MEEVVGSIPTRSTKQSNNFLRQGPPSGPPPIDVLRGVEARNVVILAPNPAAEKLRVFKIAQIAFSLSAKFYKFSRLWLRKRCLMDRPTGLHDSHRRNKDGSDRRAMVMHSLIRRFTPLVLAVTIASPVAMIGCRYQEAPQAAPQENVTYNQWEHETNRPHQDLSKRSPDEQKQYSDWQRNHH